MPPTDEQLVELEARRHELRDRYLIPVAERPTSPGRGIHHAALICSDVERTIEFYQGLLGFPLVELVENRDYAGSSHFFFDLGNLSVNSELNHDAEERLLTIYFGQVTKSSWARLQLMKMMSEFREGMWAVVQQAISTLDTDFVSYANDRLGNCERLAGRPEFERLRAADHDHLIERVGARLRAQMPFLNPVEVQAGQAQAGATTPGASR